MTRRGIILFLALGVAWGIPYLLIKVAVGEVDPAFVVFGRTAVGAVLLLPIALARREVLVVLRRWKPLLAFTLVEIVVPWFFLSSAETRLPSSTAGLLLAAVPLVSVLVAIVTGRPERMSVGNWLGIVVGALGVAALVGLDVAGSDLISVAEIVVVVIGYAFGAAILGRWLSDLPGTGVMASALTLAALIYLPIVLFTGGVPTVLPSAGAIASIVALGAICSAAAFLLLFALVKEIGAVRATTITYVNPAVAIVAGALILRERITVWTVIGFVLVLAGSWLVTRRRAAEAPDPAAPVAVAGAEIRNGKNA